LEKHVNVVLLSQFHPDHNGALQPESGTDEISKNGWRLNGAVYLSNNHEPNAGA